MEERGDVVSMSSNAKGFNTGYFARHLNSTPLLFGQLHPICMLLHRSLGDSRKDRTEAEAAHWGSLVLGTLPRSV